MTIPGTSATGTCQRTPINKHEGDEDRIVASSPQDLAAILKQIERLVRLP
jgi:hypothetical protein